MTPTILIVDDEQDLVSTLAYNLGRNGFNTRRAYDGRQALQACREEPVPDLVVLDLMLPDITGLEVCRQLRQDPRTRQVPVLMLTAKGEEVDRVVGFETGADDYVVKPFSVRELLLRIRAILRRVEGCPQGEEGESGREERFGLLRVDREGCRVWVEEGEVSLTATEFKLLTTFMDRRGRVQSRDALLDTVWGVHSYVQTRTVDAHVKRLREKLGVAGGYIETLRGMGYRFRAVPEE